MYFNYIFYWVVWHVINYNFAQVIVILVTFLITFSHSLRKMCYKRTKIKICHMCFSIFLIPSAFFSRGKKMRITFFFHLRILSAHFHLLITDLWKTRITYHECVWLVKTACVWQHSGRVILHTWHTCSVGLCILITQRQVWYATQNHC